VLCENHPTVKITMPRHVCFSGLPPSVSTLETAATKTRLTYDYWFRSSWPCWFPPGVDNRRAHLPAGVVEPTRAEGEDIPTTRLGRHSRSAKTHHHCVEASHWHHCYWGKAVWTSLVRLHHVEILTSRQEGEGRSDGDSMIRRLGHLHEVEL
jgi:hypothetical protein